MSELDRYSRQTLLPEIGATGQERLLASSVTVVGCGALGTVIASGLVRAGVGRIRIVDRDYIELNNLQRQVLFDEEDVAKGLPKAIAAVEKLKKVNSQVELEPVVADVNPDNVEQLIGDVDLVLDGTDNFETLLLINDACVKHDIPWIYGAVISTYGMTMSIIPHQTPCFRCFLREIPLPGSTPTCDMVGVLGAAANVIGSLEVAQALKFLTHREELLQPRLIYLDVWAGIWEEIQMRKNGTACPTCDLGRYEFLEAKAGHRLTTLCGRDAVQISPRKKVAPSFSQLASRLCAVGKVDYNDFLLRFRTDHHELTIFPDGRTIVKGVGNEAEAKTVYARYVGL
ncbi:MAG: ThiF family adenylyltransferase [Chloroflexi bacterium]|nr:ThiF family adenylyltransferase [Chloroflexota bacterium]